GGIGQGMKHVVQRCRALCNHVVEYITSRKGLSTIWFNNLVGLVPHYFRGVRNAKIKGFLSHL
ncbi:MAG: hypothetical protein WAL85_19185, partial [Candidatus Korobacteraceae bacterium]